MDFSDRIKELRRLAGLTQDEFGRRVGIHGRHVAKYESGKSMPNAETLVRIAEEMNVSVDYLLRGDPSLYYDGGCKLCGQMASLQPRDREVIFELVSAFVKARRAEAIFAGSDAEE